MKDSTATLLEAPDIVWYQRFKLDPGVYTPGARDISTLLRACQLPPDLAGLQVLDVGTANGGVAFECERRGAAVEALDSVPGDPYGFHAIRQHLGARAHFTLGTVYDLERTYERERFDVVFLLGLLYHLRHPLHGVDQARAVTKPGGTVYLESHVCDAELGPELRDQPLIRFYRRDELVGDPSNWFGPTIRTLTDWCESSGFRAELLDTTPADHPARALFRLIRHDGEPEYVRSTPERPLAR